MKQERSATGKGRSEIKRKLFEIKNIYMYIIYMTVEIKIKLKVWKRELKSVVHFQKNRD